MMKKFNYPKVYYFFFKYYKFLTKNIERFKFKITELRCFLKIIQNTFKVVHYDARNYHPCK